MVVCRKEIAHYEFSHKARHTLYSEMPMYILKPLFTCTCTYIHNPPPLHTHTHTQFQVYSGYYYLLTVVFIGAGIYKLTTAGWLRSCRTCCPSRELEWTNEDNSSDSRTELLNPTIQEGNDNENKLV